MCPLLGLQCDRVCPMDTCDNRLQIACAMCHVPCHRIILIRYYILDGKQCLPSTRDLVGWLVALHEIRTIHFGTLYLFYVSGCLDLYFLYYGEQLQTTLVPYRNCIYHLNFTFITKVWSCLQGTRLLNIQSQDVKIHTSFLTGNIYKYIRNSLHQIRYLAY